MKIGLAHNLKPGNHLTLLASLIENSEESILCSGWIKPAGIRALSPAIEAALKKNAKIFIISNKSHTIGSSAKIIGSWTNVIHLMANKSKRRINHTPAKIIEADIPSGSFRCLV